MAEEANIFVAQNKLFACAVCLDLLKDPVTIPCGHSYCTGCIKDCWDQEDEEGSYSCPQCRQTFSPRPVVGRNLILAEMVEELRMKDVEPGPYDLEEAGPGEVGCTICVGSKRKADKSCLECLASYCETHFNLHEVLHSGRHKVVEAVEHLEKMTCSKHNKPLEAWCLSDQICICPLCIIYQHKGHDITSAAEAKTEKTRELSRNFREDIKQREKELQVLKQAVEPFKGTADMIISTGEEIFTELITRMEKLQSELKEIIIAQEQTALSHVDQLERELEQKIIKLRERITELDRLSHTDDPIHFLQSLPTLCPPQDLHKITIGSGFCVTLVSDLSYHVTDSLSKEFEALAGNVKHTFVVNTAARIMTRKELLQHFCQPKMDEDTAFRHHDISDEGTKIRWRHRPTSHDSGDGRFDDCRQVLCKEGLSGRHYWEVEGMRHSDDCISIAVSYNTIGRKGYGKNCMFGGNDQSWSLECGKERQILSFSHNDFKIGINEEAPCRIGVYLDHRAGLLDFYSVSHQIVTLLHRVVTTFTQPLYPGFFVNSSTQLEICGKPQYY